MQILQKKPLGSWPAYDYEPLRQILKPAYEESNGKMMNMYAQVDSQIFNVSKKRKYEKLIEHVSFTFCGIVMILKMKILSQREQRAPDETVIVQNGCVFIF